MSAKTSSTESDPHQPGAGMPGAIGRVVRLLRKLIDYGTQLIDTVQQRAASPGFTQFARPFGSADLAVILARITCGLRRAAFLEARLCQRAARGRDIAPAPIRLPGGPRATRQAAAPEAQPDPQRVGQPSDPRFARLPTEEEIATEVRRRPIGAVIVDICCDLGIAPGHLDRAFWDEINHAIMMYGGSLARFLLKREERWFACSPADPNPADAAWPAAPGMPTPATGPP
jgi:hypothetical protein